MQKAINLEQSTKDVVRVLSSRVEVSIGNKTKRGDLIATNYFKFRPDR